MVSRVARTFQEEPAPGSELLKEKVVEGAGAEGVKAELALAVEVGVCELDDLYFI